MCLIDIGNGFGGKFEIVPGSVTSVYLKEDITVRWGVVVISIH